MATPEPRIIRSVDVSAWAPPLPQAPGFDHLVVETPGLHTHLAAIGEGEPVVLLHGFPQHWWQWHAVAPVVAASGYRVICPDLRGAGWTVAEDPRVERETRLRDLLALFDALGIERAHVVAHDMGVITAMQLTYDHPERVRTAVQLSVPPAFMRFSPKVLPAFRHLPPFFWHRPGVSLRGVFSKEFVAHPMSETVVEAHLAPMRRPDIDGAVRPLFRGMALPEAIRMARGVYRRRRLTVPTLVVLGRPGRPWTEEIMARVCGSPERYADRVEFAYVDDAAHFITDDAPLRSPTSRSTGLNEQLDAGAHYSVLRSPHPSTLARLTGRCDARSCPDVPFRRTSCGGPAVVGDQCMDPDRDPEADRCTPMRLRGRSGRQRISGQRSRGRRGSRGQGKVRVVLDAPSPPARPRWGAWTRTAS